MRSEGAVVPAALLFGISAAFLALYAVLQIALRPATPRDFAVSSSPLVPQLALSLLGLLIVTRRPRNAIGWSLGALGVILGVGMVCTDFPAYVYRVHHDRGPLMLAAAVVSNGIWLSFEACLAVLLLLFPTGHPHSRAWARVLRWGLIVSAALFIAGLTAHGQLDSVPIENPVGLPFIPMSWVHGPLEPGVIFLCLGVVGVAHRLWVSRGEERQQLKWLTYSAAFVIPLGLIAFGPGTVVSDVAVLLYALALSMIPVSIAIAILKYRLYDIDTLINRTLVYGLLTATLAGFYLGVIVLLQALFRTVTSQSSDLAIVVATLAIAALFNPWRKRLQAFIDRRFYRRKYDAARTLTAFQSKLRDEVDLDRLQGELVGVVEETMRPVHVRLWLRQPGGKA